MDQLVARDGCQPNDSSFPVVCLGSSAGGLDPCIRIIRAIPADTGLAIVVVNHRRTRRTLLPELLRSATAMSVKFITEGMRVQPNHVFIIPRNCDLTLANGAFHLEDLSKPYGWPAVITIFLESMARNGEGPVVAVILSGVGSDGATALKTIKTAGGVIFAQKPESAEYPAMPQSAIDTGFVDFVLTPEEIAREVVEIAHENARNFAERTLLNLESKSQ